MTPRGEVGLIFTRSWNDPFQGGMNMKSTNTRTLILSEVDHQRLAALVESSRADCREREDYLASLEGELDQARVVSPGEVPPDVVTMNSAVRLRDLSSGEAVTYTLVYPARADIAQNRI